MGDPEYGCNLITELFKYNGVIIDTLIKEDIIDAVAKYEPRIIMTYNDIQIIQDAQKVHIYIQYKIRDTGEINQYNLEIKAEDSVLLQN